MIERTAPVAHPLVLSAPDRPALVRRAKLLAMGGIGWHLIEFAIALAAGIAASSIALIGFGVDSLVESVAGFIVLWRFADRRSYSESAERRAQQLIAISFFLLAAYVGLEAIRTLIAGDHPEASWVGIGLAAFTAPTMPLLALAKRRVGNRLGSAATVQEGVQNMVCAYLSVALLVGLLANASSTGGGPTPPRRCSLLRWLHAKVARAGMARAAATPAESSATSALSSHP